MNDYTKVMEKPLEPKSKIEFMTTIMHNNDELERLITNTRTRILNQIGALDWNELNPMPDFSEQIKLILELHDYGLIEDAKACLYIMGIRIEEFNPTLKPWYQLQLHQFQMPSNTIKEKVRHRIFIESFEINNGIVEVEYCNYLLRNDNPDWEKRAFLESDLIGFAMQSGLNVQVSDSVDHLGEHIQKEIKSPLFTMLQENIESVISNYLNQGWPTVKI
jgi:hypothetical protein